MAFFSLAFLPKKLFQAKGWFLIELEATEETPYQLKADAQRGLCKLTMKLQIRTFNL